MRIPTWSAVLALGLVSCGKSAPSSASSASAVAVPTSSVVMDSVRPLTQKELPTTDGHIAADNLVGTVDAAEKVVALRPDDPDAIGTVLDALSERQRFTSSVADLRRLPELGDRVVAAAPKAAKSFVRRAAARAAVHRFKDAKEDLATAVSLGAQGAQVDGLRATFLQADGDLDGALALRHAMTTAHEDIITLGAEASVLGELGRVDEAASLFERAARGYNDVAAPAVAWLYFQEAAMWERARNIPRARAFYEAAYERLPIYAHAASHFALLESSSAKGAASSSKAEHALSILEPIAASADDPEFEWALAQVLRRLHRDADADAHLAKARARYDEITTALPEAYAEHAANFWVADGADAQKALVWAKKNLDVRRSAAAFEVAFLAAISAKSMTEGCAFKRDLDALPRPPEMLKTLAKDACP